MRRISPTRAVAPAVALIALATVAATPCAACSCAEIRTVAEAAAAADAVFVGTFTTTRTPLVQTSSGDLVAKEFTVTEVRKGRVAATTEVLTAASGASCGLEVSEGTTYVVVARQGPDGLRSDLCSGTRARTTVADEDLAAVGVRTDPVRGERRADLPVIASGVTDVVGSPLMWGPVAGASALVTIGLLLRARRRATP
ncbi:hypothetical protein [Oryzobacter terrae]|uniref:hypothetical protein n=1 Tax=Oryzobacter terrae TaxID=1620385 RepID=UPI00366B5AEA